MIQGHRHLEGVNHCRLHCSLHCNLHCSLHCSLHYRLAKIRGMMYMIKYGAVIGPKTRFFVCAQFKFPGYGYFLANHSAVFDRLHQATDFRQTTV